MRVIPPIAIAAAMLTSSTATEPLTASAYNGGTTYAAGDMVSVAADYLIYQSLVAGNLGNTPSVSPAYWDIVGYIEAAYAGGTTYALNDTVSYLHRIYQSLQATNTGHTPLTSPLWWVDIGATNTYRCFDILRNTATVTPSPLTIVITPGVRVNSIALLGVTADSVRVRMTSSPAGNVYDSGTLPFNVHPCSNMYEYFFNPFYTNNGTVLFNLPPFTNCVITVDLVRATGNVACGSIVLGTFVDLGKSQYGAQSDTLNFSTIDRDSFGNSILIPRRNVPKVNQVTWAPSTNVDAIRGVRDSLNAVPAVWSSLDDSTQPYFQSLLILGIYKQFSIDIEMPATAVVNLELEEV